MTVTAGPSDIPDRDDGAAEMDPVRQVAGFLRIEAEFGGDWIPVTSRREATVSSASRVATQAGAELADQTAAAPEGGNRAGTGIRPSGALARIKPSVRVVDDSSLADSSARLAAIAGEIADCKLCVLHENRTHAVPGHGHPAPRLCFVGKDRAQTRTFPDFPS